MEKETFLRKFFRCLSEKDVEYYVFGEYSHLPIDTGGSDIDIFVTSGQLQYVDRVMSTLISDKQICIASYFSSSFAHHYRLLSDTWGVQIDVLEGGFKYNGIDYYPYELLKDNLIDHSGIRVLDIKKGYYIDFFKEIIHNGHAKAKYVQGFLDCVGSDISYYRNEISSLYGEKTRDLIFQNLTTEGLHNVALQLRSLMINHISKGNRGKMWFTRFIKTRRIFQKRPGYVIAVEGTDGSGKSTIINMIAPILNECFHNGIVYKHLRPRWLPDLGVLTGQREGRTEVIICSDPHKFKPSGIFGSIARWGYYLFDYTIGYLKEVWPRIHRRSDVFIFDRYYFDYYIDPYRLRVSLPNLIVRLGELFVPSPDIVLCLGGDPNLIYKRKPETSLEEVTRQNERLRRFCYKRKNAVWIDTTQDIEKSVNEAMKVIHNIMAKRFANVTVR